MLNDFEKICNQVNNDYSYTKRALVLDFSKLSFCRLEFDSRRQHFSSSQTKTLSTIEKLTT